MERCVVIGSGLGGLACGCILAKNGYDVVVLEQGAQVGGCLQCFRRGGMVFDTGMHYVGSMDAGQTAYAIAHYLGIDHALALDRLNPAGYDVVSLQGKRYRMANGRAQFVDALASQFGESKGQIEQYYDLVKRVTAAIPIHNLKIHTDVEPSMAYTMRSVGDVLAQTVHKDLLREVLGGISPCYAGSQWRTPFITHALIADSYEQSAFRIVGGSESVAVALRHSIESMGGRVLTRKKATRIVCDDKQATHVECQDGDSYAADVVISDIHPAATIRLVDSNLLRPAYRHRMDGMENTTGAFTVYLKFKSGSVPYNNHNLYLYQGDSVWGCQQYSQDTWPKFLLYMHFCHKPSPTFAETAEVITYMNYEDVKKWAGTRSGKRGDDYEDFKRAKAERVIQVLEAECPEVKGNIETYYTSTPLTYRDYTGVPQGAMYGIAKDINESMQGRVSHKTRIPNLLLTGQCTTSHGMLGVLAGSIVTCSQLLSLDTIFEQILME